MRAATFGRRAIARSRRGEAAVNREPAFGPVEVEDEPFVSGEPQKVIFDTTLDEELQAWKAERRRAHLTRIPWRQLSLMASLCFGIAAFVLPDSVNDWVDWLLYGLMGASFIAGFVGRRRKAAAAVL